MAGEFAGLSLRCVRGERVVFDGLDFAVGAGEMLALVGPNGSGKSSLLRLMAGLAAPAAGRMLWAGEAIAEDPEAHRARLHYVGHLDALKPVLTVAENLAAYAALREQAVPPPVLARALSAFGLEGLGDLPARFLSQGQRRRTALARLLAAPAPLWLLDEPTLALDDASQARLSDALAAHLAAGGRAVVATHAALDVAPQRTLRLGRGRAP